MKDKVNVYDFDDTIYNGQSWIDFLKFCLKSNPFIAIHMITDFITLFKIKYHLINENNINNNYCQFLKNIADVEKMIEEFWEINLCKIKPWYNQVNKSDDIIVTSSPEFFIEPLLKIYKFQIIGTKVYAKTGKTIGKICYGKEKIRRFKEKYNNISYDFYTDDVNADRYMISNSENSFLLKKDKIIKIMPK